MVIADNERRVRRQPLNHLEEKPQYKSRSEKFELDVLPQTNEELMWEYILRPTKRPHVHINSSLGSTGPVKNQRAWCS